MNDMNDMNNINGNQINDSHKDSNNFDMQNNINDNNNINYNDLSNSNELYNNNQINQINSIKPESDEEDNVKDIKEDLLIDEYNPSLGLSKIQNGTNYLNAIIQCFAHINDISDNIINLKEDQTTSNPNKYKLSKIYRALLINIYFPEKVFNMNRRPYAPEKFVNTLYKLNPNFQTDEYVDYKDFIDYFIKQLHEELNAKSNSQFVESNSANPSNENDTLIEFLKNFTEKNNSIISKSLYGLNKSQIHCQQCQNLFFNYQCYTYLYFNLFDVKDYKIHRMRREDIFLDLIDCLDYYQRPEVLIGNKGVMCPACGVPTESTLIKTIYSTKNVLIFIFDRKEIENTFNHDMIDYPDVINLSDYIEYKKKKEKFFWLVLLICLEIIFLGVIMLDFVEWKKMVIGILMKMKMLI